MHDGVHNGVDGGGGVCGVGGRALKKLCDAKVRRELLSLFVANEIRIEVGRRRGRRRRGDGFARSGRGRDGRSGQVVRNFFFRLFRHLCDACVLLESN